jgi:hypothetical protein
MANVRTAVWKCTTEAYTAPSLVRELASLIRALQGLIADSYRPELHYMRGPGPKWHAKHDLARPKMHDHSVPGLMPMNA